jgi:KDO2-lipid IV(A) lauroyltransferase
VTGILNIPAAITVPGINLATFPLFQFVDPERSKSVSWRLGSVVFSNEHGGMHSDQNAAPENGAFVDFFGTPACAGTGFAKIAAHSGAAVIPGFALWSDEERRYVLRFYPEVPVTGDAAADTAALQKLLESVIREYPDQWLWIHRRWKTRPPGEPSLYEGTL